MILLVIEEVFKIETDDIRGEEEVKRVSRRFELSEFESLVNFRTRNASSDLIKTLNILPTTTSECERGFFDMNLTLTDLRTHLTIENVSDLIFISINDPPVEEFNPQPYVKIWLRDHRSANSAPRGKEKKKIVDEEDEL